MINQSNFFDLKDILIYELFGDVWLFMAICLLFLWIIALKSKLPKEIPTILTVVFIGILFAQIGGVYEVVWVLMIVFIGIYYSVRLFQLINRS